VRRAIPFLVGVILLAAGCGSPGDYSPQKTRACLKEKGVRISGMLDFVASTATGGAFVAHLGNNFVTLAFGENASDAQEIESAYTRFAFDNVRRGLPDVLKRDRNAVMLWHKHPEDPELSRIKGCLK
jgi:hypothetical protein